MLITSREKPKEIAAIEGKELPVRSLQISGLGISEIKEIFKAKGIVDARDSDLQELINNYGGNPLYLEVIATTILDLFDGNVDDFLAESTTVFGDICNLINQQFQHLSQLEKSLLYWLAINRDPVAITKLKNDLLSPKFENRNESSLELTQINQFNLLEILDSLHRRSLIEKTRNDINDSSTFSLQPVVMEYVTINLIDKISREIICGEISLLQSHVLLKATAADYIQEIQKRLIITPIIERLETTLGNKEEIESYLMKILDRFRKKSPSFTGYVGGNIINILSNLSVKISDKDFSELTICQGNLQGITLNNVNFTNSNFAKTTFTDTFGIIFSLAFSPSGEFLVTGSIDGEVCLWQWRENRQLFKHQEHTTILDSITFSPDNQKIASSSRNRNIKIWDIATGKCISTLNLPDNQTVKKIVFNLDGSQLFGYSEKQIIFWNLETGNSDILIESESRISALSLSPKTGLLTFGCENGVVYLWDINTKTVINSFDTNSGVILSVKIIDNNQILASSLENKTVKIWDIHNCQCLNTFKSQSYHISLIDISINGKNLATGSGEKIVKVWNIQTGLYLQNSEGHLSEINAITFSNKNILATASVDRTIKIWDIATGKCLKTLQGRADFVHSVVFSKNSQIILSGSQHTIKFWDINTNQCLSTFFEHKDWLSSLIISPLFPVPCSLFPISFLYFFCKQSLRE
ncbi:WD40 repeat domain-containing protein [Dapis sp. BLCC M229]|uniref:WD40 repeat domain-containing protein n=1 Tax=Dapis sp. BLCC M229 TaxID=3400188 RepID=UPI003CEF3E95